MILVAYSLQVITSCALSRQQHAFKLAGVDSEPGKKQIYPGQLFALTICLECVLYLAYKFLSNRGHGHSTPKTEFRCFNLCHPSGPPLALHSS